MHSLPHPKGAVAVPDLLLCTSGTCDIDPGCLLDVFGAQRQRFVEILRGFGPDDWAAPTRCAHWSAHDVVRHLCDANTIGITAGPGDSRLDVASGFDPRTTPGTWLTASAAESPGATLDRFISTSGELLALARERLAQGRMFDVGLPFGPMNWTVLVLHIFWDTWIHERDVLLAADTRHPTDADATTYAASYGLFIAAAVSPLLGGQVGDTLLLLGGDGGGAYQVQDRDGHITLTVSRARAEGPPAAEVADALAGRARIDASLAGFSLMAEFFNA
jgi:uncharacterized protein (TIGR03083 family)